MDTKKLRQKILDLAIHGKLVPKTRMMNLHLSCLSTSRQRKNG